MTKTRKKSRGRRRRTVQVHPGAPPGTIRVDPSAPKPVIRVTAYGPDECVERTVGDVEELRAFDQPVVWVNVDGIGDQEMIDALKTHYGLHPLALEDAVNVGQRAKVDPYDEHLFVVLSMPATTGDGHHEQVSLFLGERFLLTFQERAGDCFDPVRERLRAGRGRIRKSGPDYLAYALIDAVVDSFFPILERLGDQLELLEEQVLRAPDDEIPERIHGIRRELREIRRANLPHKDLLAVLLRPDTAFVTDSTRVYLKDCWDHAVRVSETVEGYRDESSDLMAAHMSGLSNRMNEVMKVLTIMAAIFIPLSFIAGVYGMNFDAGASSWNMPELRWPWGYPAVLLLMAAVAGGLLVYFKRRKWF